MASIAVADKNKNPEEEEDEDDIIPVLTVFKKSAIIKNIFIIPNNNNNNNNDNTIVVGRHPGCNIVLTHPSISRFHLKIRFTPSSRTLSLLDLSSVHGTWVCGRKLEPGVSVDLKEGDTFTVGVSTRLYRLRFVSQFDVALPQQQDQPQQQVQVVKDVRSDESLELSDSVEQEIPMQEDIGSFCCDEERKDQSKDETFGGSFGTETSCNSDGENERCGCESHFLSPPYVQSVDEVHNTDTHIIEACPEVEMPGETNLLCSLREYFTHNLCLPVVEAVQVLPDALTAQQQLPSAEKHWFSSPTTIDPASFDAAAVAVIPKKSEFGCTFRDGDKIEYILTTGARVFNSDSTGGDVPDSKFDQIEVVEKVSVDSLADGEKQGQCCQEGEPKLHNLNAKSCHEQAYSPDEIVEDIGKKGIKNMDPASFEENGVTPEEQELGCTLRENGRIDDILTTGVRIFNSENTSLLVEEATPVTKFQQIKIGEEVAVDSISDGEKQNKWDTELSNSYLNVKSRDEEGNSLDKVGEETGKSFQVESLNSSVPQEADLNKKGNRTSQSLVAVAGSFEVEILESHVESTEKAKPSHEQGHSPDEIIVQDVGNKCTGSICSMSPQIESVNFSVPQESVLNITNKMENQTPQSLIAVTLTGCSELEIIESCVEEATEKSSTFANIWSRREKAASAPQDRPRKSRLMSTSNVDTKAELSNLKDINAKNKSIPRDIFSVLDEGMFTPNKENSSPNTFHSRFLRKKGKLEESKHSKSQRSHNLKAERSTSATSNKENQTPNVAQEWKSMRKPLECHDIMELTIKRVERVPLQSLMNSGGNCKSGNSGPVSAAKTIDGASNCGQTSDKHTKPCHTSGEQKRRWDMVVDTSSLLNKESRKALQLLQGLKGTRLIIPSLVIRELGSMKQQFRIFRRTSEAALALEWIEECMEKENTKWWIHVQDSMEECRLITSRTVEDHILDFALQYRRKENVGQTVLLSDDATLKIKSMAKGMLCETVQQFRQSLVNPYSERFMWPKSSPRGLTWSSQDDVVLREKYCGLPSKAGLMLITQQFLYLHV